MSTIQAETADRRERRPPQAYSAEKARQGEIILKTRWARIVFLTGLFGGFVLLAVLAIMLRIFG